MENETVGQFVSALRELEAGGDVEPLVALFAQDTEVVTVTDIPDLHGQDGARRLWSEDRRLFREVRSTFREPIVADGRAALEWQREATGRDGQPITYSGVSVLEFSAGKIRRFSTHFDARALADVIVA